MIEQQERSLFVPLTDFAISEAEQMALCHDSIPKRRSVFDRAVALAGVADWLRYDLGLEADLASGDFADPLLRNGSEIADLIVNDSLKIECCIVEDGDRSFMISPDAAPGLDPARIAYVVVRLPDDLVELEILGFLPAVELRDRDLPRAIPLRELYSPEDLSFEITAATFDLTDFAYLEELVKSDIDDEMMELMICGDLSPEKASLTLKKDEPTGDLPTSAPEPSDSMAEEQKGKIAKAILRRLKMLWK